MVWTQSSSKWSWHLRRVWLLKIGLLRILLSLVLSCFKELNCGLDIFKNSCLVIRKHVAPHLIFLKILLVSKNHKSVLSPCQSDIYALVIWDKPAWRRSYCWYQNKFILSPLWLIDRQHLDALIVFNRLLKTSPLGAIKRNNGQILRCEVHRLWRRVGSHFIEPEAQELFYRFFFLIVIERGPI